MNPAQPVDFAGPMGAIVYAMCPYLMLALIVGNNVKIGLEIMGQTLEGRRPKLHAVLGISFTVLNLVFAWALFVGFQILAARFEGQASLDALARKLEGTPDFILSLAEVAPWTQVGVGFAFFLVFIAVVGRPARRVRNRRRDWEEA